MAPFALIFTAVFYRSAMVSFKTLIFVFAALFAMALAEEEVREKRGVGYTGYGGYLRGYGYHPVGYSGYHGLGYHGLGYSGLGYNGLGYGYSAYPYGVHHVLH